MNRRSLIRSLFGIAVAPKMLAELNLETPMVANPLATKSLFSDLQLLTPRFYNSYIEKYGNENWTGLLADSYDRASLSWHETSKSKIEQE